MTPRASKRDTQSEPDRYPECNVVCRNADGNADPGPNCDSGTHPVPGVVSILFFGHVPPVTPLDDKCFFSTDQFPIQAEKSPSPDCIDPAGSKTPGSSFPGSFTRVEDRECAFAVVAEFVAELGECLEHLAVRTEGLLDVLFEFTMVVVLLKCHRINGARIGSEQAILWCPR